MVRLTGPIEVRTLTLRHSVALTVIFSRLSLNVFRYAQGQPWAAFNVRTGAPATTHGYGREHVFEAQVSYFSI